MNQLFQGIATALERIADALDKAEVTTPNNDSQRETVKEWDIEM